MKRSGYRGGESSGKKPKIKKEEEEVMEKKGRKGFRSERLLERSKSWSPAMKTESKHGLPGPSICTRQTFL